MQSRLIRWGLPMLVLAVVAGVGAGLAASAAMRSNTGTVKTATTKYGKVLVTAGGLTLYRFTPDRKGVSRCAGACAALWPPLLVKAGAKPTVGPGANAHLLGTIKRGAALQVTYAGFPLYRYAPDKRAGQTAGEGLFGKWYVVNARGQLVKHPMTAPPAPTTTTTPTTTSGGGGGGSWG